MPYLHYGDGGAAKAVARDNITVTCHEGFQSVDGNKEFVVQCQPSGTWNSSCVVCISNNLVPLMGAVYSQSSYLFDKSTKSCVYFSDQMSVYLHGIRTTTVEIVGPGLNCKPSAGHISVITALTTMESCSLQKENHLNNSVSSSCQYQCTPGYGILIQFANTTVCEIENN